MTTATAKASLLFTATSLCAMTATFAQEPFIPPFERYVKNPFANPEAITAFQDYIARLSLKNNVNIEIDPKFWDMAPSIMYWGYEFHLNKLGTYDISFVQRINVSPVLESLKATVAALGSNGCSYYRAKNPRISHFDLRRIDAIANIEGKQRICADTPLGEVKTDIGDIGGSAVGSMTFAVDTEETLPNGRYTGRFYANAPAVSFNADLETIFGLNINSVAGEIVSSIGRLSVGSLLLRINPTDTSAWKTINIFDKKIYRISGNEQIDVAFFSDYNGTKEFRSYRNYLQQVTALTWSIQPSFVINSFRTGFVGTPEKPTLEVIFDTTLKPKYPVEAIYGDIDAEIELMESFKNKGTEILVVRGNSLWELAKKYYGSPYYYNMLAAANGRTSSKIDTLRTGEIISLPPLYKLVSQPEFHFMSPGETVTAICKQKQQPDISKCIKSFALANKSLSLSKLRALEPIKIPMF